MRTDLIHTLRIIEYLSVREVENNGILCQEVALRGVYGVLNRDDSAENTVFVSHCLSLRRFDIMNYRKTH